MSHDDENRVSEGNECVVHNHPIPPGELARYSVIRDPYLEQDIALYVEGQARGEIVQHVEKIKTEYIMGEAYKAWDVTTDQGRWWVLTNLMNLYSQKHFPSLDYTLSFHVGLMMRLRSRPYGADISEPQPFDEVFRRQEQAKNRHDSGIEAEDYQAVGMQLRECLISLVTVLRRRVKISSSIEKPQDANFISWSEILINELCKGKSNKQLRQYFKKIAKETWQLVNWLTHDRNANQTASSISIEACDTIVGHFVQILVRERTDKTEQCPNCKSRHIRTHFDITIEPDGDYYTTCGVCGWSNHPHEFNED